LVLEGEVGIGKTTLVDWGRDAAAAAMLLRLLGSAVAARDVTPRMAYPCAVAEA
jgi:hypothetical protein